MNTSERPMADPRPVHPEVHDLVEGVASALEAEYVIADVGRTLAVRLRGALASGAFAHLQDLPAACEALTALLRETDGHLRVEFEAVPTPEDAFDEEVFLRRMGQDNSGVRRVELLEGGVGLLELTALYPAEACADVLHTAMALLGGARAILLDLRRCRGGSDAIALLAGYFFPEPTLMHTFEQRPPLPGWTQWTLAVEAAPLYRDKPLFVVTSRQTASAAEALADVLGSRGRATLVGEPTLGIAHPGRYIRVHGHARAFVPVSRPVNPVTGANWEGMGVQPHVPRPADQALSAAHRLALDALAGRTRPAEAW